MEMCSTQIQSGWRPLFSALETVHSGNKSEVKEYLVGEYSMGKVFSTDYFVYSSVSQSNSLRPQEITQYILNA